ncbi:MAG: NADH-quinone oxidoreductase subunit NuoH [Propionibacteriaceae bacterium]|jgi:NADH-quinone oxidoreductase subunit H|nr:NADH-quinone oxidoreductase subunit NuoH [Propionibacteriaceae bacterium]
MIPLDTLILGDKWWIFLIKLVGIFVYLLVCMIIEVWFERRAVGKMQHRLGPIMNGPLGLGQTVAEAVKLLAKEDFRPKGADKVVFTLAPLIAATAAFTAWSVIPVGGTVTMFGQTTSLQLTDLPMSVLFVLSVASVGIYGIVLAGWSSTSPYSILGAIRSTAQMVSYEVAMGLSLVSVFLYSSTMSTGSIAEAQGAEMGVLNVLHLPNWYALPLIPACLIYCLSVVAETNRAPFDLVECEQELVSGYCTDYSGFRYACFFLAEYLNMLTVSGMATTLFFGSYHAPWPLNTVTVDGQTTGLLYHGFLQPVLDVLNSGWFGPVWFTLKVFICIYVFIWLRGTLPRFRYDQFMNLGWRWLIPISLGWIVLMSGVLVVRWGGWLDRKVLLILLGVLVVILLALIFLGSKGEAPEVRSEVSRRPEVKGPFDALAGGYPVPPLPGQTLPELEALVEAGPDPDLVPAGVAEPGPDAAPTGEEA